MNKISSIGFVLASCTLACSIVATQVAAGVVADDVKVTGVVTCSRCLGINPHKAFTPWSWAMYMLSKGDDIVLRTSGRTYKLRGNRQQLSKYMQEKVAVYGSLDVDTINVTDIVPSKRKPD